MRRPLAEPHALAPRRRKSYAIDENTGRISVDPGKHSVVPYTLVTEPESVTVPAATSIGINTLVGGIPTEPIIMPIDNKGPFEIVYSEFQAEIADGNNEGDATADFTVAIFDPKGRLVIMNREVHVQTIAGGFGDALGAGFGTALSNVAGRPLVWPETFFIHPVDGAALFIAFRNLTTENIKIRFAFHGVRYLHPQPFEEARKEKEAQYGEGRVSWPYFYTTDTNVFLAGATEQQDRVLRLTDDSDVEVFKLTKFSDNDFFSRIIEKDSGERALDNASQDAAGALTGVHSSLMWGNAEFPMIPFESMYYERGAKLSLRLINGGVVNNRIFCTMVTRRISHVPDWW